MRDVAKHFDDYAADKGRNNAVERRSPEVGYLAERIFQWLGFELDTDIALRAGEQLFSAIANAKSKVVQPFP